MSGEDEWGSYDSGPAIEAQNKLDEANESVRDLEERASLLASQLDDARSEIEALRSANNRAAGGEMTPRAFAELEKDLAELKRYREREPLVRAVFTAIVGNADSYYNTEFAPGAIEAMRECIKAWEAAESA